MIVDNLQHSTLYPLGKAWQLAFDFLHSVTSETPDGKYNLQGEDIFGLVMSYETRTCEMSFTEAHRKYLDIQTVVVGSENIACYETEELIVDQTYEPSKDVELFKLPDMPCSKIYLSKGSFIALFPQDAHMPSLMIGSTPEFVKKIVVKVDLLLLNYQQKTL